MFVNYLAKIVVNLKWQCYQSLTKKIAWNKFPTFFAKFQSKMFSKEIWSELLCKNLNKIPRIFSPFIIFRGVCQVSDKKFRQIDGRYSVLKYDKFRDFFPFLIFRDVCQISSKIFRQIDGRFSVLEYNKIRNYFRLF